MEQRTTIQKGSTLSAGLVILASVIIMALGLGMNRIEVLGAGALLFVSFFFIFRSAEAGIFAILLLLFVAAVATMPDPH